MIDFHTHILHQIDDGSRSLQEALVVLERWEETGFREILFTPHYDASRVSLAEFVQKRNDAARRLSALYTGAAVLRKAAEVTLCDALFNNSDLAPLTVNGRHLLVELPMGDALTEATVLRLQRLIRDFKCVPILAHIERYGYLFRKEAAGRLAEMGALFQISLDFYQYRFRRKQILRLIDRGAVAAAGSDVHGTRRNFSKIRRTVEKYRRIIGTERADAIERRGEEILREGFHEQSF